MTTMTAVAQGLTAQVRSADAYAAPEPEAVPAWMREYMLRRRQALLMELGQIEELLGLERTVTPKRKR